MEQAKKEKKFVTHIPGKLRHIYYTRAQPRGEQWTMDNKKGEGLSPRLNWSNIIKEFFSFRYSPLCSEVLLPD